MLYDIWAKADEHTLNKRLPPVLIMPKMNLPKNDESYNPPEEYLWNKEEVDTWKNAHVEDRDQNYYPQQFKALRHVPVYQP